jgi:hypothetical protein
MNGLLFSKNLLALKEHGAAYFMANQTMKAIESKKLDVSSYLIDKAKSGLPLVSLKLDDGRLLSYHSKYDPVKEAAKQVENVFGSQSQAMLMGFGFGYATEQFLQKPEAKNTRLDIIEPDRVIFTLAMTQRDLTQIFSDKRLRFYVGMGTDEVGDLWEKTINWATMGDFCLLDHPPTSTRHRDYVERLLEKIRYLCNKSKGNLITMMYSGYEYHTNNFENLVDAFALPGVERLFDRFRGVPAVVVAAGPSLDKNMHLLKEVKGRFPIVAVDTALRQLVANGIKPDIVCAADSSYENSLDFVGVEDETEVALAVEPMTHPDILKLFKGPKMLMSFGGGLYSIYKGLREPVGELICWGSIATTVFDLARRLGADPIVFLGLDLSFQDGRLHARGSYSDDLLFERVNQFTSVEHETAEYINTRGRIRYDMLTGETLYTDRSMHIYKEWFEDQFRQCKVEIINATEGGIVDQHVTLLSFQEVLERYGHRAVEVESILKEALEKPVAYNQEGLVKTLLAIKTGILKYGDRVKKQTVIINRLLKTHKNTLASSITGREKAEYLDTLELHDILCTDTLLNSWFSTHQTKLTTKHFMEVTKLKALSDAKIGQWLETILEFFVGLNRFIEYQLPLIDNSVKALQIT